jgi:hypothetical protein
MLRALPHGARAAALALSLAPALVGAGSCGVSGDDPAALGRVTWRASGARFAITYVTPPWIVVEALPAQLELEIDAELFGVELDGSPPTHALVLGVVDEIEGLDELIEEAAGDLLDDAATDTAFDTDLDTSIDTDLGSLTDGDGGDGGVELPDYLVDVQLDNERDVAIAELNFLVDEQGAELDAELQTFMTADGVEAVEYQVVLDPGVFVRSFYLPTAGKALRVSFVSIFDLRTRDIDLMAETIATDVPREGGQ